MALTNMDRRTELVKQYRALYSVDAKVADGRFRHVVTGEFASVL